MKRKSLLFLLLFALLAPWAANAQTLWSEDFEDGSMPTGWTTDGPGTWSIGSGDYSTSTGAGQGTYNALIKHSTTGNVTKLITPEIDLSSVTTANLSFMHIQRSWAGDIDQLKVYYRASSSDAWTQLVAYTSAVASWTTEEDIILPNISSTYQLAFEHTDNYGYGVGIDDIRITPPATCPKPTLGEAEYITEEGASFQWTENGSATEWVLQYSTASDFTNPTSINRSGIPAYAITGLNSGTTYYVRLKSVCGGGDESDWSNTVSFSTECEAVTAFPWTEDFESYASGNFVDPCWVNEHIEGSGSQIFKVYTYSNGNNSTHQLQLPDMTSGTMTKLRLPKMTLPNDNYLFAIDVYRNTSSSSYEGEGIRVFVSTDGEIAGATELAFISRNYTVSDNGLIPAESASGWYHYELPIGVSGTCYIILRGESKYGSATYMDNFAVKEAPACPTPTGLAVVANSVTAHTAQLSWTSEATEWIVAYKTADDADFTEVNANENPFTLTGLVDGKTYTAKVRAICDGTPGEEWTSTVSFTTPIACPAPTGLAVSGTTGNQTTLNWTGTSESYDVFYRTAAYADGVYEQFGTSIPSGWEMYTGLLTDGTATMTAATYGWSFGNNNGVFDNHARVNIYSNYQRWLVTKTFTVLQDASTLSFDLALTAYSGEVSAPQTTGTDDKFIVLISTDNMATWITLREWNNAGSEYVYNNIANTATGEPVSIDLSAYVGQSVRIAFYGESTETNADNNIHIDNVYCGIPHEAGEWMTAAEGVTETTYTLTGLDPETDYEAKVVSHCEGETGHETMVSFTTEAACMVPNNLAVDYQGGTTATVSWVSDATSWNIEVNGTVTTITENPYTLTGLALATTYKVKVQAICGDGTSDWSDALSFTTDMCLAEDMCELTFELTDNYGDGWNGAYIDVVDVATEASLGQMTNQNLNGTTGYGTNELNTLTLAVCDGREIQFVWHSGSYDSECSYVIKDVNGEVILEGSGSGFETTNYTVSCAVVNCHRPTAEVEAAAESATVTITGEAETYNIRYRTKRGFNYGFEQAEAWTYDNFPPCSTYDGDGVQCWGVDGSTFTNFPFTGSTFAFGSQSGNLSAHSGDIFGLMVCPIYVDDEVVPADDWFILPALEIEDGYIFSFYGREITTQYGDEIINIGIYGETEGTFAEVIAGEVHVNSTTYQLYSYDLSAYAGQTIRLAINYVSADVFGFMFDDIFVGDPTEDTWDYVVENVASPYELTHLGSSTDYELQVQAVCGEEEVSEWSNTVAFTTLPLCEAPTNVAVSEITSNSAVVTWESEATSFDIEVNGEDLIEDVTSPYTLSNLDPATSYIVKVRTNCGDTGYSAWVTVNFTTECNAYDLPYEYGFDDVVNEVTELDCWGVYSLNSENSVGLVWRDQATGDVALRFSSYNEIEDEETESYMQVLVSPQLNTEAAINVQFEYKTAYFEATEDYDEYTSTEYFTIGYSSTTNDLSAFTWDENYVEATTADWMTFNRTVPAGTKYVAVLYLSEYSYYLYVDNFSFTESAGGQTLELVQGYNRVSIYLEMGDEEAQVAMLDALKEGLGDNALYIEGPDGITEYEDEEWFGDLDDLGLTNEQSYVIYVTTDCTVELQGTPADPADHVIFIERGWNMIGFPYSEEVEIAVALSEFEAEEEDQLEGPDGYTEYDGEEWFGEIETLVPGQGYMYYSNSEDTKRLEIQTGAKARRAIPELGSQNKQSVKGNMAGRSKSVNGESHQVKHVK